MHRSANPSLALRARLGLCGAVWLAAAAAGQVISVPLPARVETDETIVVRGTWGSDPGQFGKVDEASRPGPMDFVAADAGLYVLDPVNARVQLFAWDGRLARVIPIGTKTADFLAVDERGQVIALDAFVRRELHVFSPAGRLAAQSRLPAELGLPSAVLARDGRLYIEERHDTVCQIETTDDRSGASARVVGRIAGRPLSAAGTVRATRQAAQAVTLRTAADPGAAPEPLTLKFPRPLRAIVALESDEQGRIYVAATAPRDPANDSAKADILVAVLDRELRLAGVLCLPDAYVTDHYRKLAVTRAGELIQMQTTEDEVRFVRWALPPAGTGGQPR